MGIRIDLVSKLFILMKKALNFKIMQGVLLHHNKNGAKTLRMRKQRVAARRRPWRQDFYGSLFVFEVFHG